MLLRVCGTTASGQVAGLARAAHAAGRARGHITEDADLHKVLEGAKGGGSSMRVELGCREIRLLHLRRNGW
jgi:hypothetical protein